MTPDDLVERVAIVMDRMDVHAYEYRLTYKWEDYARAAIAVALEEVAVMLDELGDSPIMADTTAAAIRAMIPKDLP